MQCNAKLLPYFNVYIAHDCDTCDSKKRTSLWKARTCIRARAYAHEEICTFTYGQHEGKTRNSAGF